LALMASLKAPSLQATGRFQVVSLRHPSPKSADCNMDLFLQKS
jgi:hypothetical protein